MNRHLQRVFAAYALAVLVSFLFVPWQGVSQGPEAARLVIRYAPLWRPPQAAGIAYFLDFCRIFLEVVTLTLVLLLAIVSLWGEE